MPLNLASKSLTGDGLRDVERLALRNAFGDVEHHDIAELLQADEMSQRAADLTGADEGDLVTRHREKLSRMRGCREARPAVGLSL